MRIHSEMNLVELTQLMGERFGAGYTKATRYASTKEAEDLRELLVRDFPGQYTDDIPDARWALMCCAVDPEQQTT